MMLIGLLSARRSATGRAPICAMIYIEWELLIGVSPQGQHTATQRVLYARFPRHVKYIYK